MQDRSNHKLETYSRVLAAIPNPVGRQVLRGLAWIERGPLGKLGPFLVMRKRADGHQEAYRRLFPASSERGSSFAAASPTAKESRRAVWNHAQSLLDSLASLGGRSFPIRWEDDTDLQLQVAKRQPVVLVTLHVGNLWVAADGCSQRLGEIDTVAGTQIRSEWDESIHDRLAARQVRVHVPGKAYRAFRRTLGAGGRVLLHLDGTPTPEKPRNGSAPDGVRAAARLIASTRSRVYGATSRADGPGRYKIRIESLTEVDEAGLLRYLRQEVSADPSAWQMFRANHLGSDIES